MSAAQWIAIIVPTALFVGTMLHQFIRARMTRLAKLEDDRLAKLEAEVLGREGLRADIARLAQEGAAREIRILEAIRAQAETLSSEMQELRTEVNTERQRTERELNTRIDREMEATHRMMRDQQRRLDGMSRLYRA